jgi:hypothetical protein
MTHILLDIITTAAITYKGYFFLFLTPGTLLSNLKPDQLKDIDKHIKSLPNLKNPEEARNMISAIVVDGFGDETKAAARNKVFLTKLAVLKKNLIDYYLQNTASDGSVTAYNCDIHAEVGKRYFQLLRFRMVIQPEIQITVNVHKQSQITYLTVKGFWLNDNGEKQRKFQRSIGRSDEYKNGKDDHKATEEGIRKMQEVLYEEYLSIYHE